MIQEHNNPSAEFLIFVIFVMMVDFSAQVIGKIL